MNSESQIKSEEFQPRQGSITQHQLSLADRIIEYQAIAQWQTLFEKDKPIAELFYTAYLVNCDNPSARPLTFVFNGGPGAASAYLHMGALGPKRVDFEANGDLPKPPVKVLDNLSTWLIFSDLVFIDPIGTGFSRVLPPEKSETNKSEKEVNNEKNPKEIQFWEVEQDLKALGEFMQSFLSANDRWLSPIFIAGESYGGFRVAKLARKIQEDFGIGLSGAIIISPVLEFSVLEGNDYNLSYWLALLPSLAAAAVYHGKSEWLKNIERLLSSLSEVEDFSKTKLLSFLASGELASDAEKSEVYQKISQFTGLPIDLIAKHRGRIDKQIFARELLRSEGKILGFYDAAVTAYDPFSDRLTYQGTDPTLDGVQRLFNGAINHHLRANLKVKTDLTYHLLNFDVFKEWKFKLKKEFKQGYIGSVDDLRVSMSLNPYMKVYIAHGVFDLVTTYYASKHLIGLMKLVPELKSNLQLELFLGGHMFYTWESSRQKWFEQMNKFYLDI